jgi:hypothetical protein
MPLSRRLKDNYLKALSGRFPIYSFLGFSYDGVPAPAGRCDAEAGGPFRMCRGTFPHR